MSESELALELDPLDSEMQISLGYALGIAGMVDAAIVAQQKAVELDPTSPYPHEELANLYEKKGMYKESIAESVMRIRLENNPREREDADFLERTYRARGFKAARIALWERRLERTVKESQQGHHVAVDLAGLYARLGEKDLAFYWLNKACEEQGYVRGVPEVRSRL